MARVARADVGLRRRLVVMSLGLRPGDLRTALDVHPVKISSLLNGEGHLSPEESRRAARLFSAKARELFE